MTKDIEMTRYARSEALFEEARSVVAGGVNSNVRYDAAPVPLFFTRAEGAYLYDADGNEFVDYVLGNGPAILGHAPRAVTDAVGASLALGQVYAGQHEGEIALARRIAGAVPCAELVRLNVTGSEAIHAAIRLARAHTGRQKIVKFEGHYHGWIDNVSYSVKPPLNAAGPASGPVAVPMGPGQAESAMGDVIVLPWNDADALDAALARDGAAVAAVVMEPIMCNSGVIPPRPGYLARVRAICDAHGVVLIFDEVITGFRVALGGAQALYGVTPDLAVYAKSIAGGLPLSAVAGRADIMRQVEPGNVVHAGTNNGNVACVAAALATLTELARDDGAAYRRMTALGSGLMAELTALAKRHGRRLLAQGPGPIFSIAFTDRTAIGDYRDHCGADHALMAAFADALQAEGVRIARRGTLFLSTAHGEPEVERTLAAADAAFRRLAEA